jgi:hypothetical protein
MTATSLNFALLDASRPEVARLIAAMVQARDAVDDALAWHKTLLSRNSQRIVVPIL